MNAQGCRVAAGSPRRSEDVTGVHPRLAIHYLMLRELPYAGLGLERRRDFDVAITRRLPTRLGLGGSWFPDTVLVTGSVAITGCLTVQSGHSPGAAHLLHVGAGR